MRQSLDCVNLRLPWLVHAGGFVHARNPFVVYLGIRLFSRRVTGGCRAMKGKHVEHL